MAIILTKEEVENVKKYKYTTSPATFMDGIFDPFWNATVNALPEGISPNLITCCGIIFPLVAFFWQCTHDIAFNEIMPASVLLLNGFGIFWYQTLDAIDGKQARRIDNCSPLGQLLDHNLDQFSHTFFCINALAMARSGASFPLIFMIINGQLLPHYTIEYRKHFTQFHATVVETVGGIQIGATESCMIMYGLQVFFALNPGTNSNVRDEYDFQKIFGLPFELIIKQNAIICFATFLVSIQYNLGNLYAGFNGAKDKAHAVACMIPFFTIPTILYLSSVYSQFWEEYVVCFVFGAGMLMTNMTGNLNLKSCVLKKFNPIYMDPFIFCGLLYLDANKLVEPDYLKISYGFLVFQRAITYALFMKATISQLCHYLDIPFLETKQVYLARKNKKD